MSRLTPALTSGTLAALIALLAGCGDLSTSSDANPGLELSQLECSIPQNQIFSGGVPVDGIPSLQDPEFVPVGHQSLDYMDFGHPFPDPRIIGVVHDDQAWAVPHNILWWHEIVNLDLDDQTRLAVTYCPLTGSGMVFDRGPLGGATLGVSGLIFRNNLMMYDRGGSASLFPQMMRAARCGIRDGSPLPMFPAVEMRWSEWKELHPQTMVVSDRTGFNRNYRQYPYGSYESNSEYLFPVGEIDPRRPEKERVLGYPVTESASDDSPGGLALPFGELERAAEMGVAAVPVRIEGSDALVLWSTAAQGGGFYRPVTEQGDPVEIEARDGELVDVGTGSVWSIEGRAIEGARAGERLVPLEEGYVAFWFAWEIFHPDTELWEFEEGVAARPAHR